MSNIFELVTTEENNYQTTPHNVTDTWSWRMPEHILTTVHYKNSVFVGGKDENRPFKNIILPILTLQYTAEDFDVKDINIFVDNAEEYYKSFILKKYHDKWARENHIDTFIDELVESYVDFGGVLVKNVNQSRPEVVKLQSIAFCDQGNLLGGTIGIKHSYSPDQLKEIGTELGWGNVTKGATMTLDEVIKASTQQENTNTPQNPNSSNKKTGKNIEVYEVHGTFPQSWLSKSDGDEYQGKDTEYAPQLHVVCFYKDKEDKKQGVCLFKGKESESPFKLLLRDEIYNRALGRGGAEELFEAQIWTNWDEIVVKEMMEQASKIIYQTADTGFTTRNNTKNADNGEVWTYEEGKPVTQVNTQAVSFNLFDKKISEWDIHAKQLGFANDALMGVSPTSGTPFALQELVIQTGKGPHDRRKGKMAEFLAEIYRDWSIPHFIKEVTEGKKFITELSLDELQKLAEDITECQINKYVKDQILNGQLMVQEEIDALKESYKQEFMSKGSDRFFEIFKDEFKNSPINVKVNVAGKQYNLAEKVQKLTNIFRQVMSAPQVLQDPKMAQLFNQIVESSGLDPINFSGYKAPVVSPIQQQDLQVTQ